MLGANKIVIYEQASQLVSKGPVTHTITHVQRTKNEEFWSVRRESLGVCCNSLGVR